jgi:hypothetical protein
VKTSSKSHGLLFALALMGVEAEARPGHFLTWRQGFIKSVDPQRNVLSIAQNDNQTAEVFRWNRETHFLDQAVERHKSGRPIDQSALMSGESVKILFQSQRGEGVAKRIVINTSDRPKTIQAVGR